LNFGKSTPRPVKLSGCDLEGRFILSKGKANRLIGVTQNISARKKTEEMLASDSSAMTRLHDVSTHMATEGDLTRLLQEVLDAAIVIASADMGTLKVIDPESGALLIRAHRGLAKPFLDFCEAGHEACCGVSEQGVREDRRIYVEDVAASSLFAEQGQPAAFQEAGIDAYALQCTSLLARSGQLMPFMQADTTLDHSSGGLGLGLALVRGLTQLHGGTVSAHSDGDGKGSVFTISLPIATEIVPVDDQDEPRSSAPARSRRVLIIEDIRGVAETLRSLLEEEGHAVVVAYDGFEGMIRAREFHPEILLCDIGLPGMNGYEVARAFCSDENLHNVYLISLTGYARPEDQQKAKEAGFHRHLSKPVNPAKLKEVLAQIE